MIITCYLGYFQQLNTAIPSPNSPGDFSGVVCIENFQGFHIFTLSAILPCDA